MWEVQEVDMLLQDTYIGMGTPFEGNLTVWLRSLPAGAKVTKATIQVEQKGCEEVIDFGSQTTFGATQVSAPSANFVEVDFHARRTLVMVEGNVTVNTGAGGDPTLQVDMGGTYIGIASDGTFMDSTKKTWLVTLTSKIAPLPGLTVRKFRLSGVPDTVPNITKVHIQSFPSNVSVRVGLLPAFWTHQGELAVADTSPDFALILNAFLATAQPQNGFYAVPFIIHSDTLAQVNVTLSIEYVIAQSVLPSYLPEVSMSYAFSPQPDLDPSILQVMLPKGAMPVSTATNALVRGDFQPTRVALKSEGAAASPILANVVVSPDCSLAQPFRSATEIALTGIDLSLSKALPDVAGLNIAIQADNDGKPSGQVLIRADLVVGKPLPDQSAWGSATLPTAFRVLANTSYWLVLESLSGQATWIATPLSSSALALQCSRDGGLSWRPANAPEALAPLSAQFRLRNIPASFTIPIKLDIGTKPGDVLRPLDEFAPLGRVELTFGFGDALGQYIANQTAAAPCGTVDLVINGDFSQPPPDDAALKLFGTESKAEGTPFIPTVKLGPLVNLSVERFVTLTHGYPDSTIPTRIDCAGVNPAQTTPDEIVNAITQVFGNTVTNFVDGSLTIADEAGLFPWCRNQVPAGWQGTTNQTCRSKMTDGTNRVAVLLADPVSLSQAFSIGDWNISNACFPSGTASSSTAPVSEASLSQVISVAAGCMYQLSFSFQLNLFDLPNIDVPLPPSWQVTWLDTNGSTVRIDSETFGPRHQIKTGATTTSSDVVALLTAPADAVNANLSIINSTPDAGVLLLFVLSFTPTLQSLRNDRFQQWGDTLSGRSPVGWTLESGLLDSEVNQVEIKLLGTGSDDTVLSQQVAVNTGNTYELRVQARPDTPLLSNPDTLLIQQRARIELQWLSNGQPGAVVILALDGQNFSESAWAGTVPPAVTQATIRLIQPKGSNNVAHNLLVSSVMLHQLDLLQVPLTFLSDAPGQLTVSQMQVVYDVPAAATSTRATANVTPAIQQQSIRPGNNAQAPLSNTSMTTIAAQPPGTAPAAVGVAPAQPSPVAITEVATLPPLTAIPGIGEARAYQLESIGIDSLEKLAAAVPGDIAQALKGVTIEMATRFIKDSNQLMRGAG